MNRMPADRLDDVERASAWAVRTVDYHTAGEPFRIVADLPFSIEGDSVIQRRSSAQRPGADADLLRRMLVNEPRGHADMYGGFIVPPNDDGAHFGVLFWHKDGFSTACGHGTMALGCWAVRSGLVASDPSGVTPVVIDVPSGRVSALVRTKQDAGSAWRAGAANASAVTFRNVPSRLTVADVPIATEGFGEFNADVVWGGATYACVRASDLGLHVAPEQLTELIDAGRQVKAALRDHPAARHPTDARLDGVYGTIIYEDASSDAVERANFNGLGQPAGLAQRNVTIFADGQVDRSPCGSGTAARVAALDARGELAPGDTLVHYSIVGSRFSARVVERLQDGVIVDVSGSAHAVGSAEFALDPADELGLGFVLR
jgi:proline racemase